MPTPTLKGWSGAAHRFELDDPPARHTHCTGAPPHCLERNLTSEPTRAIGEMVRWVVLALLSKREAITIANAAGLLLPGAVRGAQFHPCSPPLRHLATNADYRHQRAGAGAGRSAVSPKTFNRIDRARAQGAALPGRNRAQRGSRPRGCTNVDAASGRRPSSGRFEAPIQLMPLTLASSVHKVVAGTPHAARIRSFSPLRTRSQFRSPSFFRKTR